LLLRPRHRSDAVETPLFKKILVAAVVSRSGTDVASAP
jgi:hypothetical protein